MKKITVCEQLFEPSTWQDFDVDDVPAFLFKHFNEKWPESAHIYLDHVAKNADITPYDDAGIERLSKLNGHFFVVVYPEGLETSIILAIVAIAVAAVAIGLSFLLRPSTPKNKTYDSANNLLANRENKARPNSRIPDIFGQVWATFDLLSVPYTTFINNVEYEHCYMCVGRGAYNFDSISGVLQIRDNLTPMVQIDGASVQVYGPHKNPNILSTPDIIIGTPFTEEVFNLAKFGGVNNQLLQAPNVSSFNQLNPGPGPLLKFRYPNIIETNTGADLRTAFQTGDTLYLGGEVANDDLAHDPAAIIAPVHLGGIYSVSSVSATQVFLSSPATINPNWNVLNTFSGSASNFESASIMANNPLWIGGNSGVIPPIGPFFLNYPNMSEIICNFVATGGLYKVDNSSQEQTGVNVTIEVGVTPCDAGGNPTGPENLSNVTLFGSHTDRQAKGATLNFAVTPGVGGVLVRAHRTTAAVITTNFTNVDAVNWRDMFVVTPVCTGPTIDFGDVTTIQTLIRATPQAVAISQRKLNALVTRKVPVPAGSALAASRNAADILCAMAVDPFIGNLQAADIDITGIYAVAGPGGSIETYFTPSTDPTKLNEFCYTFEDVAVSFEESAVELATAICSVAYRRGGKLSLAFEKQTANSTLLFNHRNKIPKSETRTVTFGTSTNNDGIVLDYIEPNAPNYPNQDTTVSLYFPPSLTATNPKKITAVGVRNLKQAMTLGWRLYLKLIGQNTVVQFDATEESALLVQQDRILVADNTRGDTQDGEVIAQASLLLTLSQNVVFVGGHTYTIFLQHPDATIEGISITAGPNPNQVVLGTAPSVACITDVNNYAITTYMIVANTDTRPTAFLMSEKTPKGGKIYEVKAVNYSDSYYAHDQDIVTGPPVSVVSPCLVAAGVIVVAGFDISLLPTLRIIDTLGQINATSLSSSDAAVTGRFGGATLSTLSLGALVHDAAGNIYSISNHMILKITPSGIVTHIAGDVSNNVQGTLGGLASTTALDGLTNIAIDSIGNLYVTCNVTGGTTGRHILCINRQLTTQTILGVSIAAGCIDLVAGVRNTAGNTGDGGAATSALLKVGTGGICLNSSGDLYICDANNNRIRVVDHVTGVISNVCGDPSGTAGHSGYGGAAASAFLSNPGGICCDSSGNIYFGGNGAGGAFNNYVAVVNRQGSTRTFFGVSISSNNFDVIAFQPTVFSYGGDGGAATAASWQSPTWVSLSSIGDLYCANNTGSFVLRKIDHLSNIVTKYAGTVGTNGHAGDGGPATGCTLDNANFSTVVG